MTEGKPEEFNLLVQGGLLDNLGINMYANLGKCLVEFAANAYDSDSPSVEISLDVDGIAASRAMVRAEAIRKSKASGEKVPSFVEDALDPKLTVQILDRGHGMSPSDIQTKFLPINRNRRRDKSTGKETSVKTEAGKRYVMGRKGIGKLSGFGAASRLTVETKRAGDDFATRFVLDLSALKDVEDISRVTIAPEYVEGQNPQDQGTKLVLENLKCDSMKFDIADLHEALAEAFYPIKSEEFDIRINDKPLERVAPKYAFVWPPAGELNEEGFATATVGSADDTGTLPFKYVAKFRSQSLKASKRGARVYCNNRLAFGPSLLSLNTGTHNFMAHQYMEFIVQADELDRQNVDLISTDRGDILRNSDLVDLFMNKLTSLMAQAIAEHGKERDRIAEREFEDAPEAENVRALVNMMSNRQKTAAKKIVKIMVARYGVDSEEFNTIAPLLMTSMNAGEVLVELIKVANNPQDIANVASHLVELKEIERSDALKIFRGRRDGIAGLKKLTKQGEDTWSKGPRTEAELHQLLKTAPWLIKPELSAYVTSDRSMGSVLSSLTKELVVDTDAPTITFDPQGKASDVTRPDLVFLLGNTVNPDRILVVELKSTTLPLEDAHLTQLTRYMRKVEQWLHAEFPEKASRFRVEGMLIGAMPPANTKAEGCLDLLDRIKKRDIAANWEVIGLHDLLERTEMANRELIAALEADETSNAGDYAAA